MRNNKFIFILIISFLNPSCNVKPESKAIKSYDYKGYINDIYITDVSLIGYYIFDPIFYSRNDQTIFILKNDSIKFITINFTEGFIPQHANSIGIIFTKGEQLEINYFNGNRASKSFTNSIFHACGDSTLENIFINLKDDNKIIKLIVDSYTISETEMAGSQFYYVSQNKIFFSDYEKDEIFSYDLNNNFKKKEAVNAWGDPWFISPDGNWLLFYTNSEDGKIETILFDTKMNKKVELIVPVAYRAFFNIDKREILFYYPKDVFSILKRIAL